MGNGISALIAGVSYNSTRKIIVHPILVDAINISTLYCLKTCLALKACLADSVRVTYSTLSNRKVSKHI